MTTSVQVIFQAAQRLTPAEQLELIEELSRALQRQYQQVRSSATPRAMGEVDIPAAIRRTPPITDLTRLAADFWPENETADEINAFIAQQRTEDRKRDA